MYHPLLVIALFAVMMWLAMSIFLRFKPESPAPAPATAEQSVEIENDTEADEIPPPYPAEQ
jgi:hypothetical protein